MRNGEKPVQLMAEARLMLAYHQHYDGFTDQAKARWDWEAACSALIENGATPIELAEAVVGVKERYDGQILELAAIDYRYEKQGTGE